MKNTDTSENHYIYLSSVPPTPLNDLPGLRDCTGFDFITMVQFCDLAEAHRLNRHASYNDFGGDRGKYPVEPARMARAAYAGKQLRKYVLVSAAADFFKEKGVIW